MRQLTLEEVKNTQLDILKEFDAFCKDNDIQYFLCNGSLLGAIKYSGYIPWDDDIDVCLLRKDYNRLIRQYNDPEGKYTLFSFEKNQEFLFPFAKLADQRTKLIENGAIDSIFGVNIDVFPIDCFGDNEQQIRNKSIRFSNLRRSLSWARLRDYKSKKVLKSILKWVYSLPYKAIGGKHYCKKMMREAVKQQNGRFYGNVVWGFYGVGEAFEGALFEERVMVTFEDGEYPAPKNYDQYLTGLYGQWRKDPPLEKQKTHHYFQAYIYE